MVDLETGQLRQACEAWGTKNSGVTNGTYGNPSL